MQSGSSRTLLLDAPVVACIIAALRDEVEEYVDWRTAATRRIYRSSRNYSGVGTDNFSCCPQTRGDLCLRPQRHLGHISRLPSGWGINALRKRGGGETAVRPAEHFAVPDQAPAAIARLGAEAVIACATGVRGVWIP